jgi:hypothetical protein
MRRPYAPISDNSDICLLSPSGNLEPDNLGEVGGGGEGGALDHAQHLCSIRAPTDRQTDKLLAILR